MSTKTPLEQLEAATAIQTSDGNWNCDPYMHGMANGMIFALACMKGQEPVYLEAPKVWLKDVKLTDAPTSEPLTT